MKPYVITLVLFLSPWGWADWSEPGHPFTGALQWEGEVTHHGNPWQWQIGYDGPPLTLAHADGEAGRWQGLLAAMPLVLGKMQQPLPAGREGVIPTVSFGRHDIDIGVTAEAQGEQELLVPVRAAGREGAQIGTLRFRVQSLAAFHAYAQGSMVVATLSDAALSREGPHSQFTRLQQLFGDDAPAWLMQETLPVSVQPLTALAQPQFTELDAVYAVQVVAGSGELQLSAAQTPLHWQAILPVNIEFQ